MNKQRNHQIRVRVNQEELEKIEKKVEGTGLSPSQFLRMLGLTADKEKISDV